MLAGSGSGVLFSNVTLALVGEVLFLRREWASISPALQQRTRKRQRSPRNPNHNCNLWRTLHVHIRKKKNIRKKQGYNSESTSGSENLHGVREPSPKPPETISWNRHMPDGMFHSPGTLYILLSSSMNPARPLIDYLLTLPLPPGLQLPGVRFEEGQKRVRVGERVCPRGGGGGLREGAEGARGRSKTGSDQPALPPPGSFRTWDFGVQREAYAERWPLFQAFERSHVV